MAIHQTYGATLCQNFIKICIQNIVLSDIENVPHWRHRRPPCDAQDGRTRGKRTRRTAETDNACARGVHTRAGSTDRARGDGRGESLVGEEGANIQSAIVEWASDFHNLTHRVSLYQDEIIIIS